MSDAKKVLVTGESVSGVYLDQLTNAGLEVANPQKSFPPAVLDEGELQTALEGCVAYIVGGDEWASKAAMESAGDLKVVAFLGVGYQSFVDANGARELGIPVTNTPGTYANSVAEMTIGMLLDRRRRIFEYAESFRNNTELAQEKMYDLAGHSIGILGMGHIARRIAAILTQGFQAKVYYSNRSRKPDVEDELGLTYLDLKQLVAQVESLIIMIPEEPSTVGKLNSEVLEARSADLPGLQLVDTARPEIVDPGGLVAALESGRVESVAFDGFYRDDSEAIQTLRNHPKVLVTPHIASLTHDARDAMSQMAVDTVLRILSGEPDPNIVNGVRVGSRNG